MRINNINQTMSQVTSVTSGDGIYFLSVFVIKLFTQPRD